MQNPPGEWQSIEIDADEVSWATVDVSPDGGFLIFDFLGDLYRLPIEGGEAVALTEGIAWDFQPRFSPDGSRIAFISDRSGAENVWTMNADGEDLRQVTEESDHLLHNPAWTPDGDFIAARKGYVSRRSIPAGSIWLYHRSGGSGVELVERLHGDQSQKNIAEPAFSPDGRYLYYSQDTHRRHDVAIQQGCQPGRVRRPSAGPRNRRNRNRGFGSRRRGPPGGFARRQTPGLRASQPDRIDQPADGEGSGLGHRNHAGRRDFARHAGDQRRPRQLSRICLDARRRIAGAVEPGQVAASGPGRRRIGHRIPRARSAQDSPGFAPGHRSGTGAGRSQHAALEPRIARRQAGRLPGTGLHLDTRPRNRRAAAPDATGRSLGVSPALFARRAPGGLYHLRRPGARFGAHRAGRPGKRPSTYRTTRALCGTVLFAGWRAGGVPQDHRRIPDVADLVGAPGALRRQRRGRYAPAHPGYRCRSAVLGRWRAHPVQRTR